jgi:hypothetical protein
MVVIFLSKRVTKVVNRLLLLGVFLPVNLEDKK